MASKRYSSDDVSEASSTYNRSDEDSASRPRHRLSSEYDVLSASSGRGPRIVVIGENFDVHSSASREIPTRHLSSSDRQRYRHASSATSSNRMVYHRQDLSHSSHHLSQSRHSISYRELLGDTPRKVSSLKSEIEHAASRNDTGRKMRLVSEAARLRGKLAELSLSDDKASQLSNLSPIDIMICEIDVLLNGYGGGGGDGRRQRSRTRS